MSDEHRSATSRYRDVEEAEWVLPDGRRVVFLRRRFVPDPAQFADFTTHRVVQGDRLDRLAAQYLGDPEQFWRLADANGVLDPRDLEELARRLRITMPEGVPGSGHA